MQPSLLDRLIDEDPASSKEPVQYRALSYEQLKRTVARDLENLLNTKTFLSGLPGQFRELQNSLYVYGIPDFTSKNPASPAVRHELRQEIEKAVRLFEPRLQNVTVRIEEGANRRELRFKINALLVMDRDQEQVSFDTLFDVNRGEYVVPK
jgi:type VI secretion system protein ImpF